MIEMRRGAVNIESEHDYAANYVKSTIGRIGVILGGERSFSCTHANATYVKNYQKRQVGCKTYLRGPSCASAN